MKVLMLVATSVATDTRVLREARTLVDAGNSVHIVGRSVPEDFDAGDGITVSSVGTSSVFRAEGQASLSGRKLSAPVRFARWVLLPQHRRSSFGRWAGGAHDDAKDRTFDVVHAHDFTALSVGESLARTHGVPLVYDSHELWSGLPREHRPTPLANWRERRLEARLGGSAAAVLTVCDGVADALGRRYGWRNITVVRNSFPFQPEPPAALTAPTGLVYAGRVAAFRELETISAASADVALPITVVGPADETFLSSFDRGRIDVVPVLPLAGASELIVSAGLSLVTHSDKWENHRLAMPNKLFHAVSLGVPVVATDVGELARMVRKHNLGTLYAPGDAGSLIRAVGEAVAGYEKFRVAVEAARGELSWSTDAARLLDVYAKLARRTEQRSMKDRSQRLPGRGDHV